MRIILSYVNVYGGELAYKLTQPQVDLRSLAGAAQVLRTKQYTKYQKLASAPGAADGLWVALGLPYSLSLGAPLTQRR